MDELIERERAEAEAAEEQAESTDDQAESTEDMERREVEAAIAAVEKMKAAERLERHSHASLDKTTRAAEKRKANSDKRVGAVMDNIRAEPKGNRGKGQAAGVRIVSGRDTGGGLVADEQWHGPGERQGSGASHHFSHGVLDEGEAAIV